MKGLQVEIFYNKFFQPLPTKYLMQ